MYVKGKSNKFRVLQNTKKERKNLMENLVKKAKSGDSNAFSQLIRMNTQSMYKVAWEGGLVPALLEFANGHFLRGIWKMITG